MADSTGVATAASNQKAASEVDPYALTWQNVIDDAAAEIAALTPEMERLTKRVKRLGGVIRIAQDKIAGGEEFVLRRVSDDPAA